MLPRLLPTLHRTLRHAPHLQHSNHLHTSPRVLSSTFTNILASDIPPPVQVTSLTTAGIRLADGLLIPSACIFLEGKVFLWDVPELKEGWKGWGKEVFEVFEVVVPKPGMLWQLTFFSTGCSYWMQKFCYWEQGRLRRSFRLLYDLI